MLYGVLQGQTKSNWMMILPVFAVYAVLYYFVFKFVIEKFDLPTPGRDDDEEEVKLYTKADYQAKKGVANEDTDAPEDPISFMMLMLLRIVILQQFFFFLVLHNDTLHKLLQEVPPS